MRSASIKALVGIAALLFSLPAPASCASPPAVEASAAVLMDAETGTVLFEKSMHQPRSAASTTKVMTALLALEAADLPESLTIGPEAQSITGSSLCLKPGDMVSTSDLLAALLMHSANDAAVVLAAEIAGSAEAFADRMNARARQLGAVNTHFVNPHGLHHPDHHSSAYDLALMTREALKYQRFRDIVASKTTQVGVPSAPGGTKRLVNHNKLLWRADFVDGVKTGYVRQSGHCLIASGTEEGWRLIAVLLNTPDMYGEAQALLEYGFENFSRHVYAERGDAVARARVRGGREPDVPAVCQKTLACVTGPGIGDDFRLEVSVDTLDAPVAAGVLAGEARLLSSGEVLSSSPLVSGEAVPRSSWRALGLWLLRAAVLIALGAMLCRAYAKAFKANCRRGGRLPT